MSKTIDEKVVEMRFDNKQFESGVATSMSTLEKLKRSLKLDGAAKGLENIDSAAKKVDMSGLGGAVESIKLKFSALDVVAVTALANITNSAVNAGIQLAKSLSVDQVAAGWQKFSDKTTSVATLVAQGNAIEDVTNQLDRLNWFTDETSYNFTEMVANIAKFTATGKGLEESVTAMEGIATWAALSGQNAATASRAMYQLSQAMGAGVMRKEDYKSIQNASMDTEEFRQKCIDAGVALGTLKDNGDGTYQSLVEGASDSSFAISQFADHLTEDMWLTSDVMMKVFNEYSSAVEAIYNAANDRDLLASEVIDEIRTKANSLKTDAMTDAEAIDSAIRELGYTLSDGSLMFDSFGLKAFEAAQKARTFQDAIDSVKDAVSTGWMNTFELLFGNAEKATELWTDVANQLWDVFAGGGERRNEILDIAMTSKWGQLAKQIEDAGGSVEDFESKLKETAKEHGVAIDDLIKEYGSLGEVISSGKLSKSVIVETINKLGENFTKTSEAVDTAASSLEHYQEIINKVVHGEFGNGADRINKLTEAGENAAAVQKLLNRAYIRNGYHLTGATVTLEDLTAVIGDLSEAELESVGYTEEQAQALKELAAEAERTGTPLNELIENLNRPSGQELIFDIIHNSLASVSALISTFREAWAEIFPSERVASALYNALYKVQQATERMVNSIQNNAEELKSTFKGVIAILDILGSFVGGAFKAGFEILGEIFGSVNSNILETTGNIGDVIVAFRDWLKENDSIGKLFDNIVRGAEEVIKVIKKWIKAFKDIPIVRKVIDGISDAFDKFTSSADDMDGAMSKVTDWFRNFEKSTIIQTALTGLSKAFKWLGDAVEDAIVALGEWFEVFKETEGVNQLVEAVENLVSALWKLFRGDIDANEFARALGNSLANILISLPKMAIQIGKDFIAGFANGLGDGISGVINGILEFCSNFISAFAEALGIHSPSWISYQNAVDWWQGFINGCKDMLGPIMEAIQPIIDFIKNIFTSFWDYITDDNGVIEWDKIIAGGITIESLIILKQFAEAMDKFASAATSVAGVVNAAKSVVSNFAVAITKLGTALSLDFTADAIMKMAIAIGILAASVWLLCQIGVENIGDLVAAVAVIGVLALILYGLANAMDKMNAASLSIGKDGASLDGLKTGLIQIGLAMLMLAAVVKIIGGMDPEEATRGLAGLLKLAGGMVVFLALISVISLYAKDVTPFGNMMIKMAIALGLMVIVMKMISKMSPEDISLGIIVMGMFSALCIAMAIANRWAGALDGGSTFLKMAAAMGIMVIVLKMLRSMDTADVVTGIAVLQAFVILLAEMALVNRLAGNNASKFGGTIMSMSFSMLLLAGVLLILSKMDEDAVKHGIKVMQYFVLLIGELILVSKLAGKESAKITGNLIGMSIAIGILAGVCVLLGYIDEEDLQKGLRIVSVLGLIMAAMIWASRGTATVNKNFTAMAIAIGVMAASAVALSFIDDSKLVGAVAAIGTLMLIFGLITKLSAGATASIGSLIVMTIVVVLLGAVLWGLSLLNVKSTLEVAASLSMLMLALGGSLALMAVAGPLATAALPGIGVMLLVLIAVGTIIGVLCQVPNIDSAISVSVSLSVLILALSAACFIMAAAASKMAMAMAGAKQILIVLGVIVAIMAVLATFSAINPEGTIAVMKTMGQAIGEFVGGIITGVGNAALSLLPALGQALSDFMTNAQAFIDIAGSISPNIISGAGYLTAAILLLTAADFVSGLASILTLGNGSLGTVGTQLKTFGEGVKECFDVIKDIDSTAVDSASNVASMILALSECKTKQLESLDFSGIGEKLNTFGASVVQFSDTIKGKIDEGAVEAATKAGELLVTLNDSLPRSGGFLQDIIGEKDFARFSDACSDFADCIIAINEALSKEDFVIQTDKIKQIVDAGTWFSDLNAALPRAGGIAQDLAGEQDLSAFGSACSAFAAQVLLINNLVSGEDFAIQTDKIQQIVDAGTWFSELNAALPRAGGIAQDLAGEKDLSVFGEACSDFADCIIEVNSAVNQEGFSVNLDAIEDLKNAGLKLNELQEALPKSGGWIQTIAGEQDISDFGEKIEAFGTAMSDFSTSIVDLDDGRIDLALRTANRIKTLSESCAELDISGVYTFSTGAGEIGYAIEKFGKIVDDVDESAITASASTAHSIKRLVAGLSDLDVSGIDKFKPEAIGTAMKSYSNKVAGIDASSVSSSITSANRLRTFISSLSGLDTSGVGLFKSAMEELATVNVSAFVEAFSGATEGMVSIGSNMVTALAIGMKSKASSVSSSVNAMLSSILDKIKAKGNAFKSEGGNLGSKLANGISSKKSSASSSGSSIASSAVSGVQQKYYSMVAAGEYLGNGLIIGIKSKKTDVYNAAFELGERAVQGELDGQNSSSPSKETIKAGKWLGEGLIIGIKYMGNSVYNASEDMGKTAVNATRSAMTTVLEALNSDMDAQPSIRPVLDLSDVHTGVNAINGMLDTTKSLGVQSNLSAIGYSMNAMRQNGKNDEVISAINKLYDKLDGVGNTYNNINGVTYDDGSNVAEAIGTLVRYAKIGGRV